MTEFINEYTENEKVKDLFQVDPDLPTPLYIQLKEKIRLAAEQGVLQVGEALIPERELAQISGVSRVTVKKAIEGLVDEGMFIQKRGAGTFLFRNRQRILDQSVTTLKSFSEDIKSRGMTPKSVLIESQIGEAQAEEVFALALSLSSDVFRLTRVRLADDEPMAYEVGAVPKKFLSDTEEAFDSLYIQLAEKGYQPVRALQKLRAVNLDDEIAHHLNVSPGAAALYIERTAYSAQGNPVEFTRSFYRADRYDFVAELLQQSDFGHNQA